MKPTPFREVGFRSLRRAERFDGRISFDGFAADKNLVIGS